jgi:septum formation protein
MALHFSKLILGSTSPYRRELLARLNLAFEVHTPQVDETPFPHESPQVLAMRLALAKAQAVAALHPGALVIGSDQVANLNGSPMGKPGTHARAVEQLRALRGQCAAFYSAVALTCTDPVVELQALSTTTVHFRNYSDSEIEHYLRTEQPYDCAGSAKSEGLGIALLSKIESDDPTALIGLPLISTCDLLRRAGLNPLQP